MKLSKCLLGAATIVISFGNNILPASAETVAEENSFVLEEIAYRIVDNSITEEDKEYIRNLPVEDKETIYSILRMTLPWGRFYELTSSLIELLTEEKEGGTMTGHCGGYRVSEWIESSYGGNNWCFAEAVYLDYGICGVNFPRDYVVRFPCGKNQYPDPSRIRIWATNKYAQCALQSGVSTRVYDNCIEVCIGYWTAFFCWASPMTMTSMYVFYR